MHAVHRGHVYSLSFYITAPHKTRKKGSFWIIFLYQIVMVLAQLTTKCHAADRSLPAPEWDGRESQKKSKPHRLRTV